MPGSPQAAIDPRNNKIRDNAEERIGIEHAERLPEVNPEARPRLLSMQQASTFLVRALNSLCQARLDS